MNEPYSHVGIVIREGDRVRVYDVDTGRERALSSSSFEEFFLQSKELWLLPLSRVLTDDEKSCVKAEVKKLFKKNPAYDYTFSEGEESLYCLEFLQLVISRCGLKEKVERLSREYPQIKKLTGDF